MLFEKDEDWEYLSPTAKKLVKTLERMIIEGIILLFLILSFYILL